jgi:hypothetical protein
MIITSRADADISFIIRPMTKKGLADLYGVHRKTMARWLKPFEDKLGRQNGYLYTIAQVRKIFELLGMPIELSEEQTAH